MVKSSQFGKISEQAGQNKWAGRKYFSDLLNEQAENLWAGWFSVGICKYKPGYKSHDLLWFWVLSLVENLFKKENSLQDLLSSLNAVISTNESTQIITGHVIYNLA